MGSRRGRRVGRAEPRRSRHELEHGAAPQRLPKVVGAADEQRPHLVDGGDAAVSGRATSHPQGADRLYRTVACLRLSCRLARLRSAGRRDGVDRVGLAVAVSQLAVRAIHLHDGHALGVQEASESGSVATGPFDADTLDRTESPKPGEQRAVAGPGRRERPYPELSATLIERGDHVLVAVRVGASRDAPGGLCHGGHRHPFS